MNLSLYISVISADEVVHIIDGDKTKFFGKLRNAYSELGEEYLNKANVISVYSGFGGLCIEAVL